MDVYLLTVDIVLSARAQADSDALHDSGWLGAAFSSADNGTTWAAVYTPTATDPTYLVKPCLDGGATPGSTCFRYPLRAPATGFPPDHTTAVLPSIRFEIGSDEKVHVTGFANSSLVFPASEAPKEWGNHTYLMVTDGSVLPLRDGSVMMLLYGSYQADPTKTYAIAAMESTDGVAWKWRSTVSHGQAAPCNEPSEHDCTRLASGAIFCVWRTGSGPICSSTSTDDGLTWSTGVPLPGRPTPPPPSPPPTQPLPPVPPACAALLDAYCSNQTANRDCIESTTKWYGPAALPMFGLFGPPCSGLRCPSDPADHNCTCTGGGGPWAWRCYSTLSLDPTDTHWSNTSRHPNAYCSSPGRTLESIYAKCAGKPWPPPPPTPPSPPSPKTPTAPFGVEPKLAKLPLSGKLVLSTGRPGLWVWVADDPPTEWVPFNLAAHHNAVITDPKLRFASDVPSTSGTTSYTGMVPVPGTDDVIVSYDRLANGWSPAPWPEEVSAIFTVRVTVA